MDKEIEFELKALQNEINELYTEIEKLKKEMKSTELLAHQAYNTALFK